MKDEFEILRLEFLIKADCFHDGRGYYYYPRVGRHEFCFQFKTRFADIQIYRRPKQCVHPVKDSLFYTTTVEDLLSFRKLRPELRRAILFNLDLFG